MNALDEPVPLRTLATGGYAEGTDAVDATIPKITLVSTKQDYEAVWRSTGAHGQPPEVDFAHETVFFLFLGLRTTAGYAVEPVRAHAELGGLVIETHNSAPAPRSMSAQVITAPYAVVAAGRTAQQSVRWVNDQGDAVAVTREQLR